MNSSFLKTILKTGLLVGILDIAAALTNYVISSGKNPLIVLKYIASAVVGTAAFAGGVEMVLLGLVFHFIIAMSFTVLFFLLYPTIKSFISNKILLGVLYGIFIWLVMNLGILPLTNVTRGPFNPVQAIIGALILVGAIGLPLAFYAERYYGNKPPTSIS